jgi:hypothetical protein
LWGLAVTQCNTFDDPPNREPSPIDPFPNPVFQPPATTTCCPPAHTTAPIVTQLPPVPVTSTSTWATTTTAPRTDLTDTASSNDVQSSESAPSGEQTAPANTDTESTDAGLTDGGITDLTSNPEVQLLDGGAPNSSEVITSNDSDAGISDARATSE